jgi:hypothetical protein
MSRAEPTFANLMEQATMNDNMKKAGDKPTVLFCGKTQHGDDLYRVLGVSENPNEYYALKPYKGENQYPPAGCFVAHHCQEVTTVSYAHPPKKCMGFRVNEATGRTLEYEACDKFMAAVKPKPAYRYMVHSNWSGHPVLNRGELVNGELFFNGLKFKDQEYIDRWYDTPQQAVGDYLKLQNEKLMMDSKSLKEQAEKYK